MITSAGQLDLYADWWRNKRPSAGYWLSDVNHAKANRREAEHGKRLMTYLIRHVTDEGLYRNKIRGWVDRDRADRYPEGPQHSHPATRRIMEES